MKRAEVAVDLIFKVNFPLTPGSGSGKVQRIFRAVTMFACIKLLVYGNKLNPPLIAEHFQSKGMKRGSRSREFSC